MTIKGCIWLGGKGTSQPTIMIVEGMVPMQPYNVLEKIERRGIWENEIKTRRGTQRCKEKKWVGGKMTLLRKISGGTSALDSYDCISSGAS